MIHLEWRGVVPFAVIIWLEDGEEKCRTVCYEESELVDQLARHEVVGDFYASLAPVVVEGVVD